MVSERSQRTRKWKGLGHPRPPALRPLQRTNAVKKCLYRNMCKTTDLDDFMASIRKPAPSPSAMPDEYIGSGDIVSTIELPVK